MLNASVHVRNYEYFEDDTIVVFPGDLLKGLPTLQRKSCYHPEETRGHTRRHTLTIPYQWQYMPRTNIGVKCW